MIDGAIIPEPTPPSEPAPKRERELLSRDFLDSVSAMSRAELGALKLRLEDQRASIAMGLEYAAERYGEDVDKAWARRCRHADVIKQRELAHIDARLDDLARENKERRDALFVKAAERLLKPATVDAVWDEVERVEGRVG